MLRILNAEPENYSPAAKKILIQFADLTELQVNRSELIRILSEFDILIVRLRFQVDDEIIDAGKKLKAIATATTGLDHIDAEYAKNKGIKIVSLRGEFEFLRTITATAEHTWALLLSLIRKVPNAFAAVCRGEWDRDRFKGNDLVGKRLGILGLGRIGEMVAKYGHCFGMDVHAFDPYKSKWVSHVQKHNSIPSLLSNVDVLSIHLPFNDETFNIVGKNELAQLPPHAIVLNTARGDIVDPKALLDALTQEAIAGAALDVLPEERLSNSEIRDQVLEYARNHENLLITPHIGGATFESMERTEIFIAKKLSNLGF